MSIYLSWKLNTCLQDVVRTLCWNPRTLISCHLGTRESVTIGIPRAPLEMSPMLTILKLKLNFISLIMGVFVHHVKTSSRSSLLNYVKLDIGIRFQFPMI